MSQPLTYSLRFQGEAVALGEGRFWAECRASGDHFPNASEAICRHELELAADGSFRSRGEISFGSEDTLTYRALGELRAGPLPHQRQGTAVGEVTGGSGRLAGACGSIASQLVLSDEGKLTDRQLGLLHLERPDKKEGRR
jgi:hypothetical protein